MQLPAAAKAPPLAAARLIDCAEEIMAGRWQVFASVHPGFGEMPDWFIDARSRRRMPSSEYSFAIAYRNETSVGNIKYVWEPSRHHHLTVLAAAYYLTSDDRYARRIASHLESWWRDNPFLHGPHWLSGIELGLRLIAWTWTRQLLASWPGVTALFEDNNAFITQLYAHQFWLSHMPSRGSSANNHIVAEAAGQFAAACVFPFFRDSARWRNAAAQTLAREASAQTFACGSNRELATDYHGFVLELLLAAAVQGEAAGEPLAEPVWEAMCRMTDVVAAMLDDGGRAPRQGDGDDGIGLLLDAPEANRWLGLLATGAKLFGAKPWWPAVGEEDLRSFFLGNGVKRAVMTRRPERRPHLLAEAGQAFLTSRTGPVWCRCDHGPHGFGRIAAHAHADALSIELRIAGHEIFADPGTYCYHGDPRWRAYFRSTFGHNTLFVGDRDQSEPGGPFLWTRHAQSRLISVSGLEEEEDEATWVAEHSGYAGSLGLVHRRSVSLQRWAGILRVNDVLLGEGDRAVPVSLSWHLGPSVDCRIEGAIASLVWPTGRAELRLPASLAWTCHTGDEQLPAGWYSPSFDRKVASTTLVGRGLARPNVTLATELRWFVASELS
ncbi:heparinase II/III family protein [Bradyrhizobium guangzhouense]|uniref:heparinase II/III family protein n=1 Tax=Bradyrhizobium guangzhouense TaxID=1325095 RepID=UPI001FE1B32F|nr:alginate lyase family protein [Bradyrhizobium guangzhouense]